MSRYILSRWPTNEKEHTKPMNNQDSTADPPHQFIWLSPTPHLQLPVNPVNALISTTMREIGVQIK